MVHYTDSIEERAPEHTATGVASPAVPPPHAARAIALIADEHRAIAGMLSAMQGLLASYRGARSRQDLTLIEAMLIYVENVPDHVHHPKEDAVLFPAVMRHAPEGKQLVDELEHDHARGRMMLAALHDALRACRDGAIGGLDRLSRDVGQFAKFYGEHMWREERQLLPLAVAHLGAEEWQCIERAFGENTAGASADLVGDYRRLHQCIVELMPPPLRSHLLGGMSPSTGR